MHALVGGSILARAPREYVFLGGLATLVVEDGIGTHVEPNVWMHTTGLVR